MNFGIDLVCRICRVTLSDEYFWSDESGYPTSLCIGCARKSVAGLRIYGVICWQAMLDACYRPADPRFADHGAKGIGVYEPWQASSLRFLNDMGLPPPEGILRRYDKSSNFAPSNCSWSKNTRKLLRNSGTALNGIIA